MPTKLGFATRLWYYFRIGYSTYLTFLLGYATTLVTVYYLAIKNMPVLLDFFPHFIPFAVLATVIGVPLSVGIGWVHLKRSPAYTSEADIAVESNPYNYRVIPGKEREVFIPLYLELLLQLKRLLEAQRLLTDDDKSRIKSLEQMLDVLIRGGYVGTPRRGKI
jgi:hypothetical protein